MMVALQSDPGGKIGNSARRLLTKRRENRPQRWAGVAGRRLSICAARSDEHVQMARIEIDAVDFVSS